VEDTGIGMDEHTQAQAFEPFFTTKGPDKGTGLGLATVYGIVSQNGGAVALESRIGVGTVVSVYFPHTTEVAATEPDLPPRSQAAGGSETVLIVEDENEVRELVRDMLASAGYTVLEAPLPHLAVDICRTYRGTIHLLLTDVVMPEASGREVAASVQAMRPAIKVLFMSGYPEYPGERGAPRIDGANLLSKPFDRQGLLGRIRDVLDGAPVSGAGSDV
jgi:CheY-like chemotaxis protein